MKLTCIRCRKDFEFDAVLPPEVKEKIAKAPHVVALGTCKECLLAVRLIEGVGLVMNEITNTPFFMGVGVPNMQVMLRAAARLLELEAHELNEAVIDAEIEFQLSQVKS
jgi:hypothetical protein